MAESMLCKKCKQLLSPLTKLQFFEHIKICDGIDHSQPLGVTFYKWPPSPNHGDKPQKTIEIGVTIHRKRPVTRG